MHVESRESGSGERVGAPKVSVCVTTFNQEKYIEKCLKSVLSQEVDFDFEVIVGDDFSTDKTRQIIKGISELDRRVSAIFHSHNVGAAMNYALTHRCAMGEYVCHLDGDDLMLPGKLQAQVDLLEKNPNCVMSTHDMKMMDAEGNVIDRTFRRHPSGIYTLFDLYRKLPFFAHSSKMVRRSVEAELLDRIRTDTIDIELHVWMAENGDICHDDRAFGVYRVGVGISSSTAASVNPLLPAASQRIYEAALREFPCRASILRKFYSRSLLNFAYQSAVLGDRSGYGIYLSKSLAVSRFGLQMVFLVLPSAIIFPLISFRSRLRRQGR